MSQGQQPAPSTPGLAAIQAPESRWDADVADALKGIDELVYRSNLLGADRALANQGAATPP